MTTIPHTPQRSLILWTLFASTCLALLQVSIYVPSIPGIARYFDVSIGAIQLTVTIYAASYAVGNLIWGPVSDRYGRRLGLVLGSFICLVASAFCVVAPNLESLFVGRVAQALGASSLMVVGRAIVRDLFDRLGTAKALSLLATSANIMPVLAPVLGGYLDIWFGWRASFIVITLFAVAITAIVWAVLPETNFNRQTDSDVLGSMVGGYARLLREPRFIGYCLANMNGGMSFYAFLTVAPTILITLRGVSPDEFGYYAGLMPVGFMASTYVSSRLVMRLGIDRMLFAGGLLSLSSGILLVLLAHNPSPAAFAIPLLISGLGNGLVMPNANAGAVSVIPALAGAASGLSAFSMMVIAALVSAALSAIEISSAMPLAIALVMSGVIVLLGLLFCRAPRRKI